MGLGEEGWTVEFVDGMGNLRDAVRSMTAMLNRFNRCKVYIGVSDDGGVIGSGYGEAEVSEVESLIATSMNNRPHAEVSVHNVGERCYILVDAEGYETPYSFDGWFYIRKCRPETSSGKVVNVWTETPTCSMKRHRKVRLP